MRWSIRTGPTISPARLSSRRCLTLVTLVAVNRELRGARLWSSEMPEPDLLGMLHHVALAPSPMSRADRPPTAPLSPRA